MSESLPASDEFDLAARLVVMRLSGVGPRRAQWLIGPSAIEAVRALRAGSLPEPLGPAPPGVNYGLVETWRAEAARIDGHDELGRHRRAGIHVVGPNDPCWPFADDPDPPVLLFTSGPPAPALGSSSPRIGIVGTRRCSTVGRRVARSLGAELTEAGVSVVSGLALGIDGAAHLGALSGLDAWARGSAAPPVPIAVVATGLDRVYPTANQGLWTELAERGLVVSEAPLGTAPERWRFPARNRLIAGLSSLLIVVESHTKGGALLTVDEAADRGVPVVAVPGSVLSAASAGSNALLVDGCPPVRSAQDVLDLIGHEVPTSVTPARSNPHPTPLHPIPLDPVDPLERRILLHLGAGEVHIDQLVVETEAGLPAVVRAVAALVDRGFVSRVGNRVSVAEP